MDYIFIMWVSKAFVQLWIMEENSYCFSLFDFRPVCVCECAVKILDHYDALSHFWSNLFDLSSNFDESEGVIEDLTKIANLSYQKAKS